MVLVAGIGVGLLVLIVIWTLTAVAVFVLAAIPKARYGIPAVLAVSVLISLVLILYPRESSSVNTAVQVNKGESILGFNSIYCAPQRKYT